MINKNYYWNKMFPSGLLLVVLVVMLVGCSRDNPVSVAPPFEDLEFVRIPEGSFVMGSPNGELERNEDEGPQRLVRIKEFYMKATPITQGEWFEVMGTTVAQQQRKTGGIYRRLRGEGDDYPIYFVSWEEVQIFLQELNYRNPGYNYRLPTEAEWEYACRAGTTTPFSIGNTISTEQANYNGSLVYGDGERGLYREETTEVKSFPPNPWGLYDMHGNVLEWCEDNYRNTYEGAASDGSAYKGPGLTCVLRGGAWYLGPADARSARRLFGNPEDRYEGVGFRIVYDAPN